MEVPLFPCTPKEYFTYFNELLHKKLSTINPQRFIAVLAQLLCACCDLSTGIMSVRILKASFLVVPEEDTQLIAWVQAVCNGLKQCVFVHTRQFHSFPLHSMHTLHMQRNPQGNLGVEHLMGSQWFWEGRNAVMHRTPICACVELTPGTALQMLNKDRGKSLDCNESWDYLLHACTKVQALLEVLFNNSCLCMIGCKHQAFSITLQECLFALHRAPAGLTILHSS